MNMLLLLSIWSFLFNNKLILHHASSVRKEKTESTHFLLMYVYRFFECFFLIYCILGKSTHCGYGKSVNEHVTHHVKFLQKHFVKTGT